MVYSKKSVKEFKKDLEAFLQGSERFLGRTYKSGELIVRGGGGEFRSRVDEQGAVVFSSTP